MVAREICLGRDMEMDASENCFRNSMDSLLEKYIQLDLMEKIENLSPHTISFD